MSLMDRLVRAQEKCVEEVALVLAAMSVGGSVYISGDEKIERRPDGYYYVNERTHEEDAMEPATVAYLFLAEAANRAVKRQYG